MSEGKSKGPFEETRVRSLSKTISWRCVAVTNSFTILVVTPTDHPLANAVAMNITGFAVFYLFERVWNQIGWGRVRQIPSEDAGGFRRSPENTEETLPSSAVG